MRVAFVIVGLFFGSMIAWGVAARLVSSQSDLAVVAGFALFIATGLLYAKIGIAAWPRVKEYATRAGLLAVLLLLTACTRVDPGYVGIRVNLYGGGRGAEEVPLVTGRVWYNPWTTDIYTFPTFMQRFAWQGTEAIVLNSSEGATLTAPVGVALRFDGPRVPELFVTFRAEADEIVDGWVRDRVRDSMNAEAANRKAVDLLASETEEFMAAVNARVAKELEPKGILLDKVTLLAKPEVDAQVEASINAVISATQKAIEAQNKVVQAKAEADQIAAQADGERRRLAAEATGRAEATLVEAESQAKANRLVAESLTPELVHWQTIQRWSGAVPQVSGGGAVPFVQLNAKP
jgi:regulator of protease activity HflC (stomatin/prohibitin superfamily)